MHHKTTNKRGMVGGAAMAAVAGGLMDNRRSMGSVAVDGMMEAMAAADERDYMQQQKSQLMFQASMNNNIGGYLMMWQDRDANAWRCTCCPKYDAVAVPVKNHSPFTYEEFKAYARSQIDGNFCCYTWKAIVIPHIVMLIGALIAAWFVFGSQDSGSESMQSLSEAPGSAPKVGHIPFPEEKRKYTFETVYHNRRRLGLGKLLFKAGVNRMLKDKSETTESELELTDEQTIFFSVVFVVYLVVLICMLTCCTNCLFYNPLRNIIANLNNNPFWRQRGVVISLTEPGRDCCCQSKMKHCIVFQYGRNGQRLM